MYSSPTPQLSIQLCSTTNSAFEISSSTTKGPVSQISQLAPVIISTSYIPEESAYYEGYPDSYSESIVSISPYEETGNPISHFVPTIISSTNLPEFNVNSVNYERNFRPIAPAALSLIDLDKQIYDTAPPVLSRCAPKTQTRRKKRTLKPQKTDLVCLECITTETPRWRPGPNGKDTLCNACGLRYSKWLKKLENVVDNTLMPEPTPDLLSQVATFLGNQENAPERMDDTEGVVEEKQVNADQTNKHNNSTSDYTFTQNKIKKWKNVTAEYFSSDLKKHSRKRSSQKWSIKKV